ncbi:CidA/LrgA family holin-like protein [Rossellomorea aquimaris]|uniref:CidA/LrgA family protein n=1 Tax=Rossellomorea aquimaris TaxID=189382 RepID=UPI001CD54666|nr:CidA/LrgA family holin-like protein [Rossellomorea aquimaris]MCA1060116.1 CidA/LrgA family holin-like protein [Rossellomorea aquimaris]
MKIIRILIQIGILYAFSFIGGAVEQVLDLPVPGSIIGLILLLACLSFKIVPVMIVEDGASFLLAILPLLFIPAMTGVINYPSLLSGTGAMLFFIVVVSTVVTMAASGFASQHLEKRSERREHLCSKHLSQS